eukprot:CAMPEP_0113834436 /NCGR_PEP_ID=MMETSP0328-20130328/8426_1 /TAXON_ID=39455 /ORGANISM="Alexandrium minutum" /LENGTH=69 /DNA_ID=CAMNT_0000802745 /DNA_START=19 /DNA_END=226 /DNA_ORIENTATION=- /assembly_acc=CAM_ASM_000350
MALGRTQSKPNAETSVACARGPGCTGRAADMMLSRTTSARSALDELHGADRAKEEDRGNGDGMHGEPPE